MTRALLLASALLGLSCTPNQDREGVRVGAGELVSASASTFEGDLFTEKASAAGLDFVHWNGMTGRHLFPEVMGAGVAVLDFDRDGDLDVFFVQGSMLEPERSDLALVPPPSEIVQDRLFQNQLVETGSLGFLDVTQQSGLRSSGYGMGAAVGDYDGDGLPDLYVTVNTDFVLDRNADQNWTLFSRWQPPFLVQTVGPARDRAFGAPAGGRTRPGC